MKKVAMIGVGKLGQDCAEVMAIQNDVVGYDVEPRNPNFPMKNTIEEAVVGRDIIFIAAPTPHDPIYGGETPTSHLPNKDFDYTIVKNILTEVNKFVNKSQLVVLISTVLPGTVRYQLEPCISNARFIYNPYLIAMGTIKFDMVNPEMVIIGTEDGSLTGDAQELIDFYKPLMENNPRYEVGTWDEAESIKIFYNTFISTKLALVNMIQDVAEKNGNINVDIVTNALAKSTYRIMGPAYMKAGLGDAGACHPRDNIALRHLAEKLELNYDLFDAIMKAREVQAENMALKCLQHGKNVTIVGKAYKPGVHYTNGSASMLVGYYIEKHGGNVNYYDKHTNDLDLRSDWTEVYLIGYWEQYVTELKFPTSALVIDPWRTITKDQHDSNIIHYGNTRPGANNLIQKKKFFNDRPDPDILAYKQTIFYELFPDLYKYDDSIHFIYAGQTMEFSIFKRESQSIADEIDYFYQTGKSKFVFYGVDEGVSSRILEKVHEVYTLIKENIPSQDFIYVVGSVDGEKVYEKYCLDNNILNKISILSCYYFEFSTQKRYQRFEYTGEYKEFPKSHRHKKFLCFNKVSRLHRVNLLEKMLGSGLLPDSYYSFEGDESWKKNIDSLDPNLYPNIKSIKHLFPLRLNITPQRSNPTDIIPEDLSYFNQTYFSIVTETSFYSKNILKSQSLFYHMILEDCMFFSEKIYKCFVLQHPFILLARPYALKALRERGYKTFSPLIDESYDLIEDDEKRLDAIHAEILRLSKLDTYELQNFTIAVKEIVEFNKLHYFSLRNFSATVNPEKYFVNVPASNKVFVAPKIEEDIPIQSLVQPMLQNKTDSSFKVYENFELFSDDKELQTMRLPSGIFYQFPIFLQKKEIKILEYLVDIFESVGKNRYSNCLNYFAGTGILGYELLGTEICQNVFFTDYSETALDTIRKTADQNQLTEFVKTHRCINLNNLPNNQKFDLVVGYPPCYENEEVFKQYNDISNVNKDNAFRKNVDNNYFFMKNFFQQIMNYCTNDVKIFFVIDKIDLVTNKIMNIAQSNGFKVILNTPIEVCNVNLLCLVNDNATITPPSKDNQTFLDFNQDIYSLGFPELEKINYNSSDFIYSVPTLPVSSNYMTQSLPNGKEIKYSKELCTGAYQIKDEILEIVQNTGSNKSYKNMLNWCSGTGILGFNLLLSGVTEKCSFLDSYSYAIQQTSENINKLNLQSVTDVFHTPIISRIDEGSKFDLVVGFPPGTAGYEGYIKFMLTHQSGILTEDSKTTILNYSRMLVDQDFKIHKEFLTNIGKYLDSCSDVYIVSNGENEIFDIWASQSNLRHKNTYHLTNMPHLCVLHYIK